MRLVIFTPTCQKSAIGRMASLVARELRASGHFVAVVRTEEHDMLENASHDFGVTPVRWDDFAAVQELVSSSDSCVYQIGNNFEFHRGALEWIDRAPGVVSLHDFYLGHLFYVWAHDKRADAEALLDRWYGPHSGREFFGFSDSESFLAATAEAMPMTEWISSKASAVITHSMWGTDRVLRGCPGPVRVVPLAYGVNDAGRVSGAPFAPDRHGRFRLATIGHINSNKRAESVLRAIGSDDRLRESFAYTLVGPVETDVAAELHSIARSLGVALEILGRLDEDQFQSAVSSADAISCLRWPALEAASASAIEAMLYGKPVFVTDTGFYSELPSEYVMKVDPDREIESIRTVLKRLLDDPEGAAAMAIAARTWASETFTATNYAAQIVDVVHEVERARPTLAAMKFFTDTLTHWGLHIDDAITEELVGPIRLFETSAPCRATACENHDDTTS